MTGPVQQAAQGTISGKPPTGGRIDALSQSKTGLAGGSGISRHQDTAKLVRSLMSKCGIPMVLDADGLNAFEGHAAELNGKGRSLVITPHPGEMARVVGSTVAAVQRDRLNAAGIVGSGEGLM